MQLKYAGGCHIQIINWRVASAIAQAKAEEETLKKSKFSLFSFLGMKLHEWVKIWEESANRMRNRRECIVDCIKIKEVKKEK